MNFIKTKEEHHFCIGRFSNLRGAKPNVGKHEKNLIIVLFTFKSFSLGKRNLK